MTIDPAIATASSVSIALLLAASAARKGGSLQEFSGIVRNYRIVPAAFALPVAAFLVAAEASLALGLLTPAARIAAGAGACALFAVYAIAIGTNLARGRRSIDCGCSFGGSGDRLSTTLLYRNAVLMVAALTAAAPASDRALGVVDYAGVSFFLLAATALYLTAETLRSNSVRFQIAGRR